MNYKGHELSPPLEIIFRLLIIALPIVYLDFSFISSQIENLVKIMIICVGFFFSDIYFKYFSPFLWCWSLFSCLHGKHYFAPSIFYISFLIWLCIYIMYLKSIYDEYKIHKTSKNTQKIIISENTDIISIYKDCYEALLNIFSKSAYTTMPPYTEIIKDELHPAIYFMFTKSIENQTILEELREHILNEHNSVVWFKSKFNNRLELYDSLFNNLSFSKHFEHCNLDNILSPLVFENNDIKKCVMILLNIIEKPKYDCIDLDILSRDPYYYLHTDFMYFNELTIKRLISNIDLYIERIKKRNL